MLAPDENRYLIIASTLITVVPLLLAGYAYYYLSVTIAQKNAVYAAQEYIRILDIKPTHVAPKKK